jgi:hypothetical protein
MDAERDERHVEEDEFVADDSEGYARRSILAAGWFRAALLLTAVAVVVAVALPSLLDWFEPTTSPVREPVRPAQTAPPAPSPAPERATARTRVVPEKPAARATAPLPSSMPRSTPVTTRVSLPLKVTKTGGDDQGGDRRTLGATSPNDGPPGERDTRWVQLGLFRDEQNAQRLARTLRAQGFAVDVTTVTRGGSADSGGVAGTYYLVRAGAFRDAREALAARDDLKARGYPAFVAQAAK